MPEIGVVHAFFELASLPEAVSEDEAAGSAHEQILHEVLLSSLCIQGDLSAEVVAHGKAEQHCAYSELVEVLDGLVLFSVLRA